VARLALYPIRSDRATSYQGNIQEGDKDCTIIAAITAAMAPDGSGLLDSQCPMADIQTQQLPIN